jgi:DNA-binding response OmpR family regulator
MQRIDITEATRLLGALTSCHSTVLWVDEDSESRTSTQQFLRARGCACITVGDLVSAAQILRTVEIHLVVARYDDERARTAASALRACVRGVPIVALTAATETVRVLLEAIATAAVESDSTLSPN